MTFEQFTNLIVPIFVNKAADINDSVLRCTFDCLFDQNFNGTIEREEFQSLLQLLQMFNHNTFESRDESFSNINLPFECLDRNDDVTFQGNRYNWYRAMIVFLLIRRRILRIC
jgi:hypothetical protein